jgi:hypothetical protein
MASSTASTRMQVSMGRSSVRRTSSSSESGNESPQDYLPLEMQLQIVAYSLLDIENTKNLFSLYSEK